MTITTKARRVIGLTLIAFAIGWFGIIEDNDGCEAHYDGSGAVSIR